MFSYRHAFHAGNHADVLKHVALIATLRHLLQKDAALTVFDTHAGAGLYRLDSEHADVSGEADDGFLKLFSQIAQVKRTSDAPKTVAPALQDYLDIVVAFNPKGTPKIYPGSPLIAQHLLREEARDRLKLFELHPTDSKLLEGHVAQLGAGRQVTVARADGFESLKPLLPPPSRRALVLIDPSYELKNDYARVAATVQDSLKRFATGVYLVWYPIIPRPEAHELPRRLKTLARQAGKPWLHATLSIGQRDAAESAAAAPGGLAPLAADKRRPGLQASGVFIVNPPHTLRAVLQPAMAQILEALGRGRGKSQATETG